MKEWNIVPTDFQYNFLTSSSRFPAFVAAWATGKTYSSIVKGIALGAKYPGNKGLIIRRNYTDLKDCYDSQTEILTDSGWKFFSDLTYGDMVLSLDKKGVAGYFPIQRIIRQRYKGVMKRHFGSSKRKGSVDFCITPNHKVYVAFPTSKNYKKSITDFSLTPIEDIGQKVVYFKKDFKWIGEEVLEMFFPAESGRFIERKFTGDDWCEFLGWYISEGDAYFHITKKTWWISISQSDTKNSKQYKEITALLKRMGIKATCVKDRIVFGSKAVGEHLVAHCGKGAPNKTIPYYLRMATPRQIRLFLKSYAKGDGYKSANGVRYNTSSRKLAGDVQELIVKSGGYAKVSIRDNCGRKSFIVDHWATTNHLDYLIIQQSKNHKTYNSEVKMCRVEDIEYNGEIFCVEVEPYHTVYVRRNGTCYWSGNSTMSDFTDYTGYRIKVQDKSVKISNGKGLPASEILFHHADELAGVIQNINLGWFFIEQAEEFDNDDVFEKLGGRLRRVLTPRPEVQQRLIEAGYLKEAVSNFGDLDKESKSWAEFGLIKIGEPLRQGFIIANTNGHNWIWRKWKMPGPEYMCDRDFIVEGRNYGKYADLVEATTFDNKQNLSADFLASLEVKKETAPSHYRRFVLNSWEETDTSDQCMPYQKILDAVKRDLRKYDYSPALITCDPAEHGNDSCVIYAMRGYEIIDEKVTTKRELMETSGNIMAFYLEHHADTVAIDDIGVGAGVRSRLRELGVNVVPINSGNTAEDKVHYCRMRDQIWMNAAQLFIEDYVSIPNDQYLIEELAAHTYGRNSKGQICVARKKDIKKILGHSPDRADALVMGLWVAGKTKRRLAVVSQYDKANSKDEYDVLRYGL